MRVVQFSDYGPPDVLVPATAPIPEPGHGTVRIRITAAGTNPADVKWRSGMFRESVPIDLPHVLGYDVAGTVDAVGEGVEGFSTGDAVMAMLDPYTKGAYAAFAAVNAAHMTRLPAGLGHDLAATLPTPALTGIQLIVEHVRPKKGETVLITGAVGAVGRFAVHAARQMGAKVIAAVRETQLETALALGASEAIVLGTEPPASIHFDHVADTVGGVAVAELCRRLPGEGRIRTVATTPIDTGPAGPAPRFVAVHPDGPTLALAAGLVSTGAVNVLPAKAMPLSSAADAHRLIEAGNLSERIVLKP